MSNPLPWSPPPDPSPNLRTALTYMSAMQEWDEERLFSTFDETLEHRILPKSLMRPVLDKNLYRSYFRGLASMFNDRNKCSILQRTIHEVIEMGDTIVIHTTAAGQSLTDTTYENEYMIILHMMASSTGDPSERKIQSVKEFVDSHASKTFFPAERRRATDATDATESAKEKAVKTRSKRTSSRVNSSPR